MRLRTASAVINFVKKLEGESAEFYDSVAQRYTEGESTFRSFATENRRNMTEIERAYYSVITDAIEGCFAFDMDSEHHTLAASLSEHATLAEAVGKATVIEENVLRFYADAIGQSRGLMADIPRAFGMAARRRKDRPKKLELLVNPPRS